MLQILPAITGRGLLSFMTSIKVLS